MDIFLRFLRNVQVITIALAAGLFILVSIMLFFVLQVKPGGFIAGVGPQWAGIPLMTTVLVGMGCFCIVLSFVVPRLLMQTALPSQTSTDEAQQANHFVPWEKDDPAWLEKVSEPVITKLLFMFQNVHIVALALREAAGVMGAIAYLLEGQLAALGLVVLAIVLMLAWFPTQTSLNQWLFNQVERLNREKQPTGR